MELCIYSRTCGLRLVDLWYGDLKGYTSGMSWEFCEAEGRLI